MRPACFVIEMALQRISSHDKPKAQAAPYALILMHIQIWIAVYRVYTVHSRNPTFSSRFTSWRFYLSSLYAAFVVWREIKESAERNAFTARHL